MGTACEVSLRGSPTPPSALAGLGGWPSLVYLYPAVGCGPRQEGPVDPTKVVAFCGRWRAKAWPSREQASERTDQPAGDREPTDEREPKTSRAERSQPPRQREPGRERARPDSRPGASAERPGAPPTTKPRTWQCGIRECCLDLDQSRHFRQKCHPDLAQSQHVCPGRCPCLGGRPWQNVAGRVCPA